MLVIGHLGKDAEVKYHGTESVISFSVAHTDKWKDNGVPKERTTWVSCSWWVENTTVAQYMKKGTQVYLEGVPEAKVWKKKEGGDPQPYLNLRVYQLQLLSSGRREGEGAQQNTDNRQSSGGGYVPYQAPASSGDPVEDLPF
jgi:single-strand DNA-binding protein